MLKDELNNAVKTLQEYFPCVKWEAGIRKISGATIEGALGDKFFGTGVVSFYADELIPHGVEVYTKLLTGLGWDITQKRKDNIWLEKSKC